MADLNEILYINDIILSKILEFIFRVLFYINFRI